MNRILAIEPDADRGVRLRQLLRENLNTVLVLSTSAHAAITAMTETRPDLILASTLLSGSDEQDLVAHLRATPALRHLPVLTIPAVVEAPATETRSPGLMSRLLRRPQPQRLFPMYDFGAVITRIEEALEQSKIAARQATGRSSSKGTGRGSHRRRAGRRNSSQRRAGRLHVAVEWVHETGAALVAVGPAVAVEREAPVGAAPPPGQHLEQRHARRVRRASLTGQRDDLPDRWPRPRPRRAGARRPMPRGHGRFARRQIRDGGRLRSAGQRADRAGEEPTDATMRLADLVAAVEAHADSGASAAELRGEFEAGVLDMVTAREVRLRDVPVVENDGRESVVLHDTDSGCDPRRPAGDVQRRTISRPPRTSRC